MFTRIKINTWGQNQTPKTFTKENFDRFDYISRFVYISDFRPQKILFKDKRQVTDCKEISENCMSHTGFLSRIYKEFKTQ